jgi:hypothetical protein
MKKDGFALLIVFFITFLLSIVTFSLWYKSSLLFDLTISREKFYKHYYLTQAIFNFATKYISKRFDLILPENLNVINQDLSFLLKIIDKNTSKKELFSKKYSTCFSINRCKDDANSLLLNVFLINLNTGQNIFTISCKLKKEIVEKVFSDGNKEKKELFIVKNYTLGNII